MDDGRDLGSMFQNIFDLFNEKCNHNTTLPSAVEGYALLTEWIGFLVVDLYFYILFFS